MLVSLVLLFCPDMLDLVERAKVEAAQLKFATLLQRYLKHKWVWVFQNSISTFCQVSSQLATRLCGRNIQPLTLCFEQYFKTPIGPCVKLICSLTHGPWSCTSSGQALQFYIPIARHSGSPDTARRRFAGSTMLITKCRLLHRIASAAIAGEIQ